MFFENYLVSLLNLLILKCYFILFFPNAEHKSYCCQACYHRRSSVAEKRKRNTRYGHEPYAHTDVFKNMCQKHASDADADICAEVVFGVSCVVKTPQHNAEKQKCNRKTPDKSEFFAYNGIYKVRVFNGKISELSLRSLTESLAEYSARAYCYFRLHNMISACIRVSLRVKQHHDTVFLIIGKKEIPNDRNRRSYCYSRCNYIFV